MVKPDTVDNKNVYEAMIKAQKKAIFAEERILSRIKFFLEVYMDKKVSEQSSITLGETGQIIIRSPKPLEDVLEDFYNEFNFELLYKKTESLTDYRNIEEVSITVYVYVTAPKNLKKILSDNNIRVDDNGESI